MAEYTWTGWGRHGKCIPIPGDTLDSFICVHCEREITAASDPEQDCPYPHGRFWASVSERVSVIEPEQGDK